jgi:hypothetical protein
VSPQLSFSFARGSFDHHRAPGFGSCRNDQNKQNKHQEQPSIWRHSFILHETEKTHVFHFWKDKQIDFGPYQNISNKAPIDFSPNTTAVDTIMATEATAPPPVPFLQLKEIAEEVRPIPKTFCTSGPIQNI